jgi:hypothetical protein
VNCRNFQNVRCLLRLSPLAGRGRIASAIRVRGSLRKRSGNCLKNARHVPEHLIVPKSKHSVVVIDKPFVANRIAGTVRMLPSINLDDETTIPTDEIHRVGADRLLPNELVSVQPPRPQSEPESIFRVGCSLSQASGTRRFGLIRRTHVETPPHPDRIFDAIRPLPASGARLAQSATA